MIERLRTSQVNRNELLQSLRRPSLYEVEVSAGVQAVSDRVFGPGTTPVQAVQHILQAVKTDGDAALRRFAREIDGVDLAELVVSDDDIAAALVAVNPDTMAAIRLAAGRIEAFHRRQLERSWFTTEPNGTLLGQRVVPLETVGCYVPGGRFPLVSTALMTVIPARVAGVERIVAATPTDKDGGLNPHLIAALHEAGAHTILRVGGAQAIAAMAYGTETLAPVHKIVGPGNLFVTLAKSMVFGTVGIDSLAGPSEVLIVADHTADADWIAADLLAQAEHDTEAAAMLITPDARLADAVQAALASQLPALPYPDTAAASLARWGRIIVTESLAEALSLANEVAPEHLELLVADPEGCLGVIRHAGSVFVGGWSTEPIGDYIAGPNHVLPTNGTARFTSSLGVAEFMRHSGLIRMTPEGLQHIGPAAVQLARLEGLEAHARAIEIRLQNIEPPRT